VTLIYPEPLGPPRPVAGHLYFLLLHSLINYRKGSDYRLAVAGVPSLVTLLKSIYSGLFKNVLRMEDYITSKDITREDLKGI